MALHTSMTPVAFRDGWRTPPALFNYLNNIYQFDVDLAADPVNALCQHYLTDALNTCWRLHGENGWCNPPYSNQQAFIDQAIRETALGFITVALIPNFNGQSYWKQIYDNAHVTNIIGRLAFLAPCDYVIQRKKGRSVTEVLIKEGEPVPGNNAGSSIIQFGGERRLPLYVMREEL